MGRLPRRHPADPGCRPDRVITVSTWRGRLRLPQPLPDNGIKLFGGDGGKLDDATEAGVEALIHEPRSRPEIRRIRELIGGRPGLPAGLESYFRLDLGGLKVVLDCANGATYRSPGDLHPARGGCPT